MRHASRAAGLVFAGILVFTACGGDEDDSAASSAQVTSTTVPATIATTIPTTPATSTAAATTTTAAPVATTTTVATLKANANTASRAELTAAITAAGVSNAARWAMEVEEYRPYPTNDPNLAKLRQNLVKYNPGPGVVDGIVSALSL